MGCVSVLWRLAPEVQVIENHRRHFGGVAKREEKFPHVAIQKIVHEIEQSIDGEQPAEEEVPTATTRQPEVARNRNPARKSALSGARFRELNAQHSGRGDPVAEQLGVTLNVAACIDRRNRKKGFLGFGFAAPVEMGKSIENLQTAHEKNGQGYGIDPVGQRVMRLCR